MTTLTAKDFRRFHGNVAHEVETSSDYATRRSFPASPDAHPGKPAARLRHLHRPGRPRDVLLPVPRADVGRGPRPSAGATTTANFRSRSSRSKTLTASSSTARTHGIASAEQPQTPLREHRAARQRAACRGPVRSRPAGCRRAPRPCPARPRRPVPALGSAPPTPSSRTETTARPSAHETVTLACEAWAYLPRFARPSEQTKYAAASTSAGNRSACIPAGRGRPRGGPAGRALPRDPVRSAQPDRGSRSRSGATPRRPRRARPARPRASR